MNKTLLTIGLILLLSIMMSCGVTPTSQPPAAAPASTNTPTPPPEPPTPTPELPTSTPIPPSPTPTVPPSTDELAARLMNQLYPEATPDPDNFVGINGVAVTPLEVGQNEPSLWVAHSYGMRDFMTEQQHFVAIYAYNDGNWQELGKIEMDDADYVDETSVQRVMLEPDNIWLELHAGVGAHSGTYHLFQFDGEDLKIALSGFSPSPGVGNTTDLNGDGTLEVILDTTDPYIFCYACGVWQPGAQVWQWDGNELVEVTLALLPDTASADLRKANNRGVTLAEAGLWQDAQLAIDEAVALDQANNIVNWNNILITMQTETLLDHVKNGAYPLLAYVFYGDYAATLDLMRPYPVEEIFGPQSPLVVETPASGWEDALRERIVGATTAALEVQPDLAAAYFLRAWAAYLVNPDDAQIVADIEKAVQLDPAESLFADSLTYLKQ